MRSLTLIVLLILSIGLNAQDDVYFVEIDSLQYGLNKKIRGLAYPPLYRISKYKAMHHQFYYTSRIQQYYVPYNYLSNNLYYNSSLYELTDDWNIDKFPNYTSYIDRIILPVKMRNPRSPNNVYHNHSTHRIQAKENTAGRKF